MGLISRPGRASQLSLALSIMVVVTYFGVTQVYFSHADQQSPQTTPAGSAPASYPLHAQSACCSVTVTKASRTIGDSQHVTLNTSIQNLSTTTLQFSPGLQMYLVAQTGERFSYTARYLAPHASVGGPLASNKTINQTLDFDLPPNVNPSALSFQYDSEAQNLLVGLPSWTQ